MLQFLERHCKIFGAVVMSCFVVRVSQTPGERRADVDSRAYRLAGLGEQHHIDRSVWLLTSICISARRHMMVLMQLQGCP